MALEIPISRQAREDFVSTAIMFFDMVVDAAIGLLYLPVQKLTVGSHTFRATPSLPFTRVFYLAFYKVAHMH